MAMKPKNAAGTLYGRICDILELARANVSRTVNTTQVAANWLIFPSHRIGNQAC